MQANKLNDPETVRKRSKLMLPPPQISDQELEEIARMGVASDLLAGSQELAEGSGATRALLANYSQTPRQGMTPMRTPQRTPSGKGDAIMMEAENLARLRESQTPLLGGDNPELHPSDFSGVTPKKREVQTPNPMLTPLATPGGTSLTPRGTGLTPRIGMTPSRDGYSFGMTPKGTPIRDELHINEEMDMHDSAKLELRRQAELKRNLRMGLSSLPEPKNEYEIAVRQLPEDTEEPEEKIEEDMSDRIAREKAEEEARLQALLRKRSKVLQRELPRPPAASVELIRDSLMRADEDKSSFVPPTAIEQADEAIRKELLNLLEHDNAKYPLHDKEKKKGAKRIANGVPVIEEFEEDELKEADTFIKEEAQCLCMAMGHEDEPLDEFVEAHRTCLNDLMYFPTRNAYGLSSVAGTVEKLAALQSEFENVKRKMDDDNKKAQRLEKKIDVLTHGYKARADKLKTQIELTFKQMNTAGTELDCFLALQRQEKLAASLRVKGLWEEVQKQKELEKTLQKRYGDLLVELERVQHLMHQYRAHAQQLEEMEAKKQAEEMAQTQVNQTEVPSSEATEPSSAMEVDSSSVVKPGEEGDTPTEVVNQASLENDMHVDGEVGTVMDAQNDALPSEAPLKVSSEDSGVEERENAESTEVADGVLSNSDQIVEENVETDGNVNGEPISSSKIEAVGVNSDENTKTDEAEGKEHPLKEDGVDEPAAKVNDGPSDEQV